MGDISVTITTEQADHDSICEWCDASYKRSAHNQRYCSALCGKEVVANSNRGRYQRDYTYVPQATPKRYLDYIEGDLSEHIVPAIKLKPDRSTMEPIKVPHIEFRRFKETKKGLVLTIRSETQREAWSERT